ncbi:MAG: hypothetical protein HY259_10900 [Chloroflexi bacterium]|nr:hypothetical protein [Chloroflexota bacterium]MBI3733947.1 hypothetical protein [Chloroflexota bacterium]
MKRIIGYLCLIILSLTACGGTESPSAAQPTLQPVATGTIAAPAVPTATATPVSLAPKPENERAVVAEIQRVVDVRFKALNNDDFDTYMSTIDQTNLSFKRAMSDYFKSPFQGGALKGSGASGKVTKITFMPKPYDEFVKVALTTSRTGGAEQNWNWVYRYVDEHWLHSEPEEYEVLGDRVDKDTGTIIVRYYHWDDGVIDREIAWLERGIKEAAAAIGKQPDKKLRVYVSPTFQTHPGRAGAGKIAFYSPDVKDTVYVRSFDSFGAYYTSAGDPLGENMVDDVRHETIHLLNDEITPLVKMLSWMSEGLAVYLGEGPSSQKLRLDRLQSAWRQNRVYSLKEMHRIDVLADQNPDKYDVVLGEYSQGLAYVQYIFEKYGGADGFWKLAKAQAKALKFSEAVVNAFGVTEDQFEQGWKDWYVAKYKP